MTNRDQDIASLLELSRHDNPHIRLRAIQSLSKTNGSRGIPILLAALDDTEASVRAAAAAALGKLRAGQAKWQLLERLGEDDVEVCLAAIEALGRIADPDTVPGLSLTLRNAQNPSLQIAAVHALSRIGGASAIAALQAAALDGTPDVQEAAARAVEAIKREGARREKLHEGIVGKPSFIWLLIGVLIVVFACGVALNPLLSLFKLSMTTPNTGISALTPNPVSTPSPMPQIYVTLNINEYSNYTVYWKQPLWESAVGSITGIEDFEHDEGDYGELSFPYLTGNGFLLTGDSSAQILQDSGLLESGTSIHFVDWTNGLTVAFPNEMAVRAFGFDYRSRETWQLTFGGSKVDLPKGRGGFVGVVIRNNYPADFVLLGPDGAQGGLSVDNIAYVSQ